MRAQPSFILRQRGTSEFVQHFLLPPFLFLFRTFRRVDIRELTRGVRKPRMSFMIGQRLRLPRQLLRYEATAAGYRQQRDYHGQNHRVTAVRRVRCELFAHIV